MLNTSAYRNIDLQTEIDTKYGIRPESRFLVITINYAGEECWCIAQRLHTHRHGTEISQQHWGFVGEEYMRPTISLPKWTAVINCNKIVDYAGQFTTIEEAISCFKLKVKDLSDDTLAIQSPPRCVS